MNDLLRRLLALPEEASTVAPGIDRLHCMVILTTLAGALAVGLAAVGFAIRFRRQPGDVAAVVTRSPAFLEWGLTSGLLALFIWWWWIGYRQYLELQTAPAGAIEVYVSAKQWMWKFAYADGRNSIAILVLPAGRPVKLLMSSRDVIHGFFVPDFRIKHDIVPGMVQSVWFQADQAGLHQILCSQYCGTSHSRMRGTVVVLDDRDFAAWRGGEIPSLLRRAMDEEIAEHRAMAANGDDPAGYSAVDADLWSSGADPVTHGRLVATQHGCMACHTEDGQSHLGPTWRGLFASQVRLADGRSVLADEQYLTRSMMDPLADQVAGYNPLMPAYQGLIDPVDTVAIIEFIKSLRRDEPRPPNPPLPLITPLAPGSHHAEP